MYDLECTHKATSHRLAEPAGGRLSPTPFLSSSSWATENVWRAQMMRKTSFISIYIEASWSSILQRLNEGSAGEGAHDRPIDKRCAVMWRCWIVAALSALARVWRYSTASHSSICAAPSLCIESSVNAGRRGDAPQLTRHCPVCSNGVMWILKPVFMAWKDVPFCRQNAVNPNKVRSNLNGPDYVSTNYEGYRQQTSVHLMEVAFTGTTARSCPGHHFCKLLRFCVKRMMMTFGHLRRMRRYHSRFDGREILSTKSETGRFHGVDGTVDLSNMAARLKWNKLTGLLFPTVHCWVTTSTVCSDIYLRALVCVYYLRVLDLTQVSSFTITPTRTLKVFSQDAHGHSVSPKRGH
uniref:Transmembrane protein n=1 Tax=Mesocestoides corti TaxID=53468 RepID=A0A5K3FSN9_MESCO